MRFADECSLWAVPFSAKRLEATGLPFLVSPGDGDPSVSRTGTLAMTRAIPVFQSGDLATVDLASGEVKPFLAPGGGYSDQALSSDGKAVALAGFDVSARDIWIIDVATGSRMRLTYDDTRNELLPRWSPDGREIAYARTTASYFERVGADDTIHFTAVDGSGETRAPIDGGYPSFDAEWKYMAFVRTADSTGRDIYHMPLDGSAEPQAILSGPHAESQPALSPDGRWLAYTSDETGYPRVYLTRFPSGQGKWQVLDQECNSPRWSPDGTRLYFVGPEVGVYEVEINAETRVLLTTPRKVVDGPKQGIDPFVGVDVTADGERLIVVTSARGPHRQAIGVVENWYAEFATRP
jgi:Tol biopolymer transport system component